MSDRSRDRGAPAATAAGRDRKAEHIELALDRRTQADHHHFDDWVFEHAALPELDMARVDTSVEFLGKRLSAPLLASCMTGGTEVASHINTNLARAAEESGIAVGVGSQRKAIEEGTHVETYEVREAAPTAPLLANLVLHYAFDAWMRRVYPHIPFERYADDAICHCRSKAEAEHLQTALAARLAACKLTLHPEKTKIVYCKDADRREDHPHQSFDFLGYTFRPRSAKNKYGKVFVSFTPAASDRAMKEARQTIKDWRFSRPSGATLDDLARQINPVVRGWIAYYGRYHRSAFYAVLGYLDRTLARWAARKYKRHKRRVRRAYAWLMRVKTRDPTLFVHWHAVKQPQTVG